MHDILWQYNSALRDHPIQQMSAKVKAKEEKAQKNDKVSSNRIIILNVLTMFPAR